LPGSVGQLSLPSLRGK